MMRRAREIAALGALLVLLDQLYRVLHPHVDLVRASLVGVTALAVLLALARERPGWLDPARGALAIFASAFGSVLLIEAGLLVSRSLASGIVQALILALAYLSLDRAIAFHHARRHGARRPWSATT